MKYIDVRLTVSTEYGRHEITRVDILGSSFTLDDLYGVDKLLNGSDNMNFLSREIEEILDGEQ